MNLVIITSVINITNTPLSYTKTRSVFNKFQRFEQTLKTIDSLNKISNKEILFIEGSDISEFELDIKNKVNYYVNFFNNNSVKKVIDGPHKSLSEATELLEGIKSIDLFRYDNIYKISGRYYLTDKFDLNLWNEDAAMFFEYINLPPMGGFLTVFYKINRNQYNKWLSVLKNIIEKNITKSIEEVLYDYKHTFDYITLKQIGIAGYISVNGHYWEQ